MDKNFFSQKLKFFLKGKQIQQKELAKELGVSHSTISNIINGRDRLGRDKALEWGNLLGIDPLWLMTQGEQGIDPTTQPRKCLQPVPMAM